MCARVMHVDCCADTGGDDAHAVDDKDEDEDAEGPAAEGAVKRDELAELATLTGQPKDIDELLYAIPVCAPYDTLQKYKFKVKLIPGGQKRGKGAKQAADLLTRMPDATVRYASSPLWMSYRVLQGSGVPEWSIFMQTQPTCTGLHTCIHARNLLDSLSCSAVCCEG